MICTKKTSFSKNLFENFKNKIVKTLKKQKVKNGKKENQELLENISKTCVFRHEDLQVLFGKPGVGTQIEKHKRKIKLRTNNR